MLLQKYDDSLQRALKGQCHEPESFVGLDLAQLAQLNRNCTDNRGGIVDGGDEAANRQGSSIDSTLTIAISCSVAGVFLLCLVVVLALFCWRRNREVVAIITTPDSQRWTRAPTSDDSTAVEDLGYATVATDYETPSPVTSIVGSSIVTLPPPIIPTGSMRRVQIPPPLPPRETWI